MQVQTGIAKGKKLKIPKTKSVRPTTSRIKKSIFDKLGEISETEVLDMFAGSGSLGIEALSRNAKQATFVEKDKTVIKILAENINNCGFRKSSIILNQDFNKAFRYLEKSGNKFDLIFIDPPYSLYEKIDFLDIVEKALKILKKKGLIVIEHEKSFLNNNYNFLIDSKSYGNTHISYVRSATK